MPDTPPSTKPIPSKSIKTPLTTHAERKDDSVSKSADTPARQVLNSYDSEDESDIVRKDSRQDDNIDFRAEFKNISTDEIDSDADPNKNNNNPHNTNTMDEAADIGADKDKDKDNSAPSTPSTNDSKAEENSFVATFESDLSGSLSESFEVASTPGHLEPRYFSPRHPC